MTHSLAYVIFVFSSSIMTTKEHFDHVQGVLSRWLVLTDKDRAAYKARFDRKLTVKVFANFPSNHIPASTLQGAIDAH